MHLLSTFVSTSKCETGYQAGRYSAGQVTNKENLIKEGDPEITETRGLRKLQGKPVRGPRNEGDKAAKTRAGKPTTKQGN